jgi:hypothetical protein
LKKYQTRYIIRGLDFEDIPEKESISIEQDFLIQKNNNEISCFIISSNKPNYDDSIIPNKIINFIDLCSIIKDHGFVLVYMGTNIVNKNEIGRKFSVKTTTILEKLYSQQKIQISRFLINEMKKLFSDLNQIYKKYPSIKIAIRCWIDARENFARYGKYDQIQFLKGITTLEAAIGGSENLRYTIAIRLALILDFMGYDPLVVFNKFKDLYTKRNNIVHGNPDKNIVTKEEIDITLDYSRKCILFCIILWIEHFSKMITSKKQIRQELLNKLDYLLLSNKEREDLHKKIEHKIEKFKLLYSG